MPDQRFYKLTKPLTVAEIANRSGAFCFSPSGEGERVISSIRSLSSAGPNSLCFIGDTPVSVPNSPSGREPGACLVSQDFSGELPKGTIRIEVRDPRYSFVDIATTMFGAWEASEQTTPDIGPRTRIHPTAFIGPGVQIGANCEIGAHASVRYSLIGNNVRVAAGARLGECGFGLITDHANGSPQLLPHFGRVIVQDGCTIGANSTIDRGFLDDTIIGEHTHIDNLCHIGHNCVIGRSVVMAAFCGISGSTKVGDGVQMGGRVGISDHRTIGDGAQLAGGAAVYSDVPAGEIWGGMPARPRRRWLREQAWLSRSARKKSTSE